MTQPQPVVAITIATVSEPAPRDGGGPVRHLVGVALLHVTEHAADISCRLSARLVPAGVGEAALVDWLTEHLPADATIIGWQPADDIVPMLLGAADEASPDAARAFIDALARAVGRGTIDLADDYGGVAAPPFQQVCAAANITTAPIEPDELLAAWGLGRMEAVAEALGVNAVAAWRLAKVGENGGAARDRFAARLLRDWRRKARTPLTTHDFRHLATVHLTRSSDEEGEND
jgi:hypothetical protein